MSQRKVRTGNFEVVTGWDAALQHYFLDIYDITVDEGDNVVYTSTTDPDATIGGGLSLEAIFHILEQWRFSVPETLRADLEKDQQTNRGNFSKRY